MTIEMENRLVSEIQDIEAQKRRLIQEIVSARLAGKEAKEALDKMTKLSKRKNDLTRPSLSAVAA